MAKKTHGILSNPSMSTQELIKRTQEVEDEKEQKKQERLKKKEEKDRKERQEKIEKLVAPFLLILTIMISFLVKFLSNN